MNGIGKRSAVPVGHTLLVPAQQPSREAAETLSNAVFTSVPSGRTFFYVVKRGDTLVIESKQASALCAGAHALATTGSALPDADQKAEIRRRMMFYLAWREVGA